MLRLSALCFVNVPRRVWKALAGNGASAVAVRSSGHSSRLKSLRCFREGEKRLLMPRLFDVYPASRLLAHARMETAMAHR